MNDVDDEVVVNAEVVLIPVARSKANVLEFIIYYKSEINRQQQVRRYDCSPSIAMSHPRLIRRNVILPAKVE